MYTLVYWLVAYIVKESKEAYFVAMRRKKGTSSEAGPVVDPQESKE